MYKYPLKEVRWSESPGALWNAVRQVHAQLAERQQSPRAPHDHQTTRVYVLYLVSFFIFCSFTSSLCTTIDCLIWKANSYTVRERSSAYNLDRVMRDCFFFRYMIAAVDDDEIQSGSTQLSCDERFRIRYEFYTSLIKQVYH